MENGDTSDYGDSVSSACITPVSPVFPSGNRIINQHEDVMLTSQVTASKSDGNLMCEDCFKNQQEKGNTRKEFGNIERDLKSKSCPECRTSFSQNDLSGSTSTLEDVSDPAACDSRSLYLSTSESCIASVGSCEDSVNETENSSMTSSTATVILDPSEGETPVESGTSLSSEKLSPEDNLVKNSVNETENSSMTSSTATVILDPSEGETPVESGTSLSSEKLSPEDNLVKDTRENVSLAEESNSASDKIPQETCNSEHSTLDNSNCSDESPCDEERTECIESSVMPSNSSSDSTLTSSVREAFPSTSTLRPSSSELFTRYLDVDGLTHVSDPVQERLRQIEMAHQAKVESLQRQLLDVQRRRAIGGDGGVSGQTSDLADEVVCKKKKKYYLL